MNSNNIEENNQKSDFNCSRAEKEHPNLESLPPPRKQLQLSKQVNNNSRKFNDSKLRRRRKKNPHNPNIQYLKLPQ